MVTMVPKASNEQTTVSLFRDLEFVKEKHEMVRRSGGGTHGGLWIIQTLSCCPDEIND